MKVTVAPGIRVVHDGKAYSDGDSADVPEEVARDWIESRWATADDEPSSSKAKASPAPKAKKASSR